MTRKELIEKDTIVSPFVISQSMIRRNAMMVGVMDFGLHANT